MKTLFPLSHTDDPITSYEAADRMVKSGALSYQEQEVWGWVYGYVCNDNHKNFTAKEIAKWLPGNHVRDYYTIQRRLSGLCNKGKIERIKIGKKQMGATKIYKSIYKKRNGCCVWRLKNGSRQI